MNLIENIAGELCRIILPIEEEVFFGDSKSNIAVCTLSSMNLLKDISKSHIINEVAIAGRLLSENKGIDSLVRSVISNEKIPKEYKAYYFEKGINGGCATHCHT